MPQTVMIGSHAKYRRSPESARQAAAILSRATLSYSGKRFAQGSFGDNLSTSPVPSGLSRNRRSFNGWVGLKTLEISRSLRRVVNSEFPEVVELTHCIIHHIFKRRIGRRRN